jgi:hypothetical protein
MVFLAEAEALADSKEDGQLKDGAAEISSNNEYFA